MKLERNVNFVWDNKFNSLLTQLEFSHVFKVRLSFIVLGGGGGGLESEGMRARERVGCSFCIYQNFCIPSGEGDWGGGGLVIVFIWLTSVWRYTGVWVVGSLASEAGGRGGKASSSGLVAG